MTKLVRTARLAGVLVALLASMKLQLRAAQPENGVREGQAVMTELGANASAITYWFDQSDGWHVVQVLRVRRLGDRIEIARVPGSSV